jgi:hypothetical protein
MVKTAIVARTDINNSALGVKIACLLFGFRVIKDLGSQNIIKDYISKQQRCKHAEPSCGAVASLVVGREHPHISQAFFHFTFDRIKSCRVVLLCIAKQTIPLTTRVAHLLVNKGKKY